MNVSDNGLDIIKRYEGCRLKAYKDPAGIWTIGYGHTNGVVEGMRISQQQADDFLYEDVQKVVSFLNSKGREWTQNEFDALISFGYNCGVGNLNKLMKDRTPEQIGAKMLEYRYAGGKILKGLERRRKDEQALFLMQTLKDKKDPDRFVQGVISNCYALNIRKEPSKTGEVIKIVAADSVHKIDNSKSNEDYYYFVDLKGYGKRPFVKIKE